jgi:hypothetical protein
LNESKKFDDCESDVSVDSLGEDENESSESEGPGDTLSEETDHTSETEEEENDDLGDFINDDQEESQSEEELSSKFSVKNSGRRTKRVRFASSSDEELISKDIVNQPEINTPKSMDFDIFDNESDVATSLNGSATKTLSKSFETNKDEYIDKELQSSSEQNKILISEKDESNEKQKSNDIIVDLSSEIDEFFNNLSPNFVQELEKVPTIENDSIIDCQSK